MPPRILLLTCLAMLAFAGNSLLCRLALRETDIDAASFTAIRLLCGAVTLWVLLKLRQTKQPMAGNWPGALALFTYAAAFSFAYLQLDTGIGALLLFGAVQLSMLLWGLLRGERLGTAASLGTALATAGLLALLLPGASAPPGHIDSPAEAGNYRHNPLVALWHGYRGKQVVDYLKVFDAQVGQSCLKTTPRSTHQIIPFSNPGWDSQKFAIDASLAPDTGLQLGVSLYGEAAYGHSFTDSLGRTGRPYGITEFHPLKAMAAPELQALLARHARHGARFVSFFLEPRWQGRLVPRPHNLFSFDPDNPQFGSDSLYQALVALQAGGARHATAAGTQPPTAPTRQ